MRALIHRRRLERDLEEELKFHLAERADRNRNSGMPPLVAGYEARRRFGNPAILKENMHDMWTFRWLEVLAQDLRYAFRTLRKSAGFTTVAILTLALGIGANTAIFSIVDAAVLRPLPYRDPGRLVELWGNVKRVRVERRGASYPDFKDWRAQSRSFEAMAAFDGSTFTLTGGDEPERVSGEVVSQPYFSLLGVGPEIGRTFRPEEDAVPQRDFVVILGNGLWKRRFGGDPAILGRTIRLGDHDFTVIGVMPAWFRGLSDTAELWAPFMISGSAQDLAERGSRGFAALARLKSGVTLAQAQSEMDGISKSLEAAHPRDNEGRAVELSPLETEILGDLRKPLLLLLAAVGFVLLIACTNVANLLLARSEARQRELAVRIALGAGRGRMLHQLTAESCLLAFGAAAAGLLLARFGLRALIAASPIIFPSYIHAGLNPEVAIFTVVVSVAAGLALGIAPAIQVQSGNIADAFKQASSHAVDSRAGRRFRNVLVVAEVAFATLLLVGAGLLIRSVQELAAIHPGYDPSHLLTLRVALPRIAPPPAGNTP
ncbi:MAG TPA: ABC transporter permease, partial [Bryobacteraceae bacterium]